MPTVDLYLYASHEVPTWLPIIRALRARGADPRLVLEPPGRNLARGSSPDPGRGWHDDKRSRLVPLVDERTHAQLEEQVLESGELPLRHLRTQADATITSAGVGWLRAWSGARIRCMYGVGLVRGAFGHGPVNAGMDLVLCPGPFSEREIAASCPDVPTAVVGYPKWAASRRAPTPRAEARGRLGLADRPTVAWLPTWADHSSLDAYGAAFERLGRDLQVVVKPHHNTTRFERSRLDAIDGGTGVLVVPTTTPLPDLVAAADVVVSDVRSGGLTEALLGGRPVVALADRSLSPDALHPDGEEAVVPCDEPDDLAGAVDDALADRGADARHRLVADLFGPADGRDAERAAAAILDVVAAVGRPAKRRLTAPAWRAAYRVARRLGR